MAKFVGGPGNDVSQGTSGNDVIGGGGGDDTLSGAAGDDKIYGGAGNDTLHGGLGNDYLSGGDGNDTIYSGAGNNTIDAGAGDDIITAKDGNDIIDGGAGNDVISAGDGNDTITDDSGVLAVDAGAGDDTFTFRATGAPYGLATGSLDGGAGMDTLVALQIENITGATVTGWETLKIAAGADVVATPDQLNGFSHFVGDQTSTITLISEPANLEAPYTLDFSGKVATGDTLTVTAYGPAIVTGHDGPDNLSAPDGVLQGGAGDDILSQALSMSGGDGADTLVLQYGATATQHLVLDGGSGYDTLTLVDAVLPDISGSTITGIEKLVTSDQLTTGTAEEFAGFSQIIDGIDRFSPNPLDPLNLALAGAGTVSFARNVAAATPLSIIGSSGNDTISGHAGADIIEGGKGTNILNGGGGFNLASYAHATAGVMVSMAIHGAQDTSGAGVDTLTLFSGLIGSNFDDTLTGGGGDDTIYGGAGNDTIHGGAGNDTINGGTGVNTLDGGGGQNTVSYANYTTSSQGVAVSLANQGQHGFGDFLTNFSNIIGSDGNDTLTGDDHDNVLSGGIGADTLIGGGGDDTLIGGPNSRFNYQGDTLTGGAGADRFVFSDWTDFRIGHPDVITDMTASDIIDVSGIDADYTQPGDQAFVLVKQFSHHIGEATLYLNADGAKLFLDGNGDGVADFAIEIIGDVSHPEIWVL